jgi:hypothetical protein
LIIQTILLDPSGSVWTDEALNVSRPDPSGADQIDAEHPSRNRKVVGSNPTSGSQRSRSAAWFAEQIEAVESLGWRLEHASFTQDSKSRPEGYFVFRSTPQAPAADG